MNDSIVLVRQDVGEKLLTASPGDGTRIVSTERGYARLSAEPGSTPRLELLAPLTAALQAALGSGDRVLSVLEQTPGCFAIEVTPKRQSSTRRKIYLYDQQHPEAVLAYTPNEGVYRDAPMRSLGPNRVALFTATDVAVVSLLPEARGLYFGETTAFEDSAVMAGMALNWLEPHPTAPDVLLLACSDGYDSTVEVYQFAGEEEIRLADTLELPGRAVESAWFVPDDGGIGFACVEVNQELRDASEPSVPWSAGSLGLVAGHGKLRSVDIPIEAFYGGLAYEAAEIDFYRTSATWLWKGCFALRTAAGDMALCDLDRGVVDVVASREGDRVNSLFRVGRRALALMESGSLVEITPGGKRT